MNILLWGEQACNLHSRLQKFTRSTGLFQHVFRETDPEGLRVRMFQNRSESMVVILAPSSAGDLAKLAVFKPLLKGSPIMVILPDDQDETLIKAHQFHPRFVAEKNTACDHIVEVLLNLHQQAAAIPENQIRVPDTAENSDNPPTLPLQCRADGAIETTHALSPTGILDWDRSTHGMCNGFK